VADQRQIKKAKVLHTIRAKLSLFGDKCLKIKTKEAEIVPFKMNRAQKYAHRRLERQLVETGKVRALFLKGRQQGISTYVAARYYHKSSLWRAINVYILAHEQKATDNLFKMVDRYHEHNPLAPKTGSSNAKELEFERLDSSYAVATAGQKAGGRGRTPTLFHGSEVAFWANAAEHFAASVQGVPDMPGTEIILESTANGPNGEFYARWQEAEAGDSDYIAIFIPWFWQEEYIREPAPDFALSSEHGEGEMSEVEYADAFKLPPERMAWRRAKIQELRSISLFDQEYPATAQLAFTNSGVDSYIPALDVLKARKRKVEGAGPLLMGCDPAGSGGDRFSICGRRGREVTFLKWRNKLKTQEGFQFCKRTILKHKPARFYIDVGGIGSAIFDLLKADGDIPVGVLKAFNFGGKSQHKMHQEGVKNPKPGPKNRRAEIWLRMKTWLEDEDEPVSIPDLDALQGDITGPTEKGTLTNDLLLESKKDMRARGVRSPDLGDSLALTFASMAQIKDYVDKAAPKPQYGDIDNRPVKAYEPTEVTGNGWMM